MLGPSWDPFFVTMVNIQMVYFASDVLYCLGTVSHTGMVGSTPLHSVRNVEDVRRFVRSKSLGVVPCFSIAVKMVKVELHVAI